MHEAAICVSRVTFLKAEEKSRRENFEGKVFVGDEKTAEMALFHRNVTVIDASGELALLSPPLLRQNVSQSRLVTSTEGRGWENTSCQRVG